MKPGPKKGTKFTEEHKENIRQAKLKYVPTEEHIKNAKKGLIKWYKKHPEARENLRIQHKGSKCTQVQKNKISESLLKYYANNEVSAKTRKNLSRALKGKIVGEETKEKLRIARMKQILPTKSTSIELKVKGFLEELNISFEMQKVMLNKSQADFFIEPNFCIYCDGDYWHEFADRKISDRKINKALRKNGFIVIRIKGSKIKKMDVNQFLEILEKFGILQKV